MAISFQVNKQGQIKTKEIKEEEGRLQAGIKDTGEVLCNEFYEY